MESAESSSAGGPQPIKPTIIEATGGGQEQERGAENSLRSTLGVLLDGRKKVLHQLKRFALCQFPVCSIFFCDLCGPYRADCIIAAKLVAKPRKPFLYESILQNGAVQLG